MLTGNEIASHVLLTGGATVGIHGRRYLMGDEYDDYTYAVGGASDYWTGEPVETLEYPREHFDGQAAQEALDIMARHAGRNVYAAAGYWIPPERPDVVVVDLVETTTLRPMALQWARERAQAAIYELTTGTTITVGQTQEA